MEAGLVHWYIEQQTTGQPVNKKLVTEKALSLSHNPEFVASKGWYQRFIDRCKNY
jgi:hypothetical protein